GKIGDFFAKLFSIDKIGALFSGRLFRDFSSRGIYFENITAQPVFDQGMLNIGNLHFGSDVMTVDAQGTLDMIDEKLKMQALLVPLATVDDALSYVPLVGDALEDVSKIRIDIKGPLADPEIHTAEAREIGDSIESEVKRPGRVFKDVDKDLEKRF
ncbi:MAG: AsmA-like C-terminal domain-containing protein, partial [Gammaproteobacteria bacterium]